MINRIKSLNVFTKNIVIVFLGTSLANFFNLLYQLLIAHKLSASEFAAFNSLLSLFMIFSSPLGTIQMAIAKYSSEFNARNELPKLKLLLSDFLQKASILAAVTFLIFWLSSRHIADILKIPAESCGYILAGMLALSWIAPLLLGAIQGMEFFGWLSFGSVAAVGLKLALAFIFLLLGYSIAGALAAFLIALLASIFIYYFPLRRFICFRAVKGDINYREILTYLFPVALSNFCFISLVSMDMVLVKYFFSGQDPGLYSVAQMAGKIFLFLPGAISIVMFPRISGLDALKQDTLSTLRRSLLYVLGLCFLASIFYNLYPSLVLKALTGKVYPESILLGRLFSVSMTFFALLFIFISYFLPLKDFRFIKYLVSAAILQFLAIAFFHQNLIQIQAILCLSAISLFFIHCFLAVFKKNL